MGDFVDAPSVDIDPYEVLKVSETASADEIKTAYRKLALLHHPDKVKDDKKDEAKQKFQQIVSAYAVLSDERRRKRYDTTGNTSESLDIDDDDFDWLDFFRMQWNETVTSASILDHKQKYQGSTQEKQDVIAAYQKAKGNMTQVFEQVEMCNVLDDEERFRQWIDEEIDGGRVTIFDKYSKETEKSKESRRKKARKEAQEAEASLAELRKKKKKSKKEAHGEGDLLALIRDRHQSSAARMLEDIEAKYGDPSTNKSSKSRKKRKADEGPPEEAFQKMAERVNSAKKARA